jgi:hypothetical protein
MKRMVPVLILAAVGFLFFLIPLLSITKTMKFKNHGIQTEGIVIDRKLGSKGGSAKVTVTFTTSEGREITATSAKRDYVTRGEKTAVWYFPENPENINFGDTIGYNMRGVVIGGLLFLLGIYYIIRYLREDNSKKKLKEKGRKVTAQILGIDRNEKYMMGEKNPYFIRCKWIDNSNAREYFCASKDYSVDPTPFLKGCTTIDIYIDPNDPHKYYVDDSFMPEGSNF